MKSRTKSTRENLTIDSKSRKISDEAARLKKGTKKEDPETRKYLLKTLSILQQNLKVDKVDKKSNNARLSASVYELVKSKIGSQNSFSRSQLQDYTSSMQICCGKENQQSNDINKSAASLANYSTIHGKRRSNSTLDDYFKQKFGSPAKDVNLR